WTSQYFLCNYIFHKKSLLSIEGFETEKKYLVLQSKYVSLSFAIAGVVMVLLSFIVEKGSSILLYGVYIAVIGLALMKKNLKKYKPIKTTD
ncbi:MAG TPA: hypothetical protein VF623_16010, partial [Segetibacter sp.]